ncbi:hypothetical protein BJ322DRAFT_1101079 [Thelephora terrestris]|uniref:HIT-type domain-containing protein n=1 Tax=Thelephora terrestris TaxID=56493 RepID=A0A9P6H9L3_9AGAM|nr:hypothetical protein BJ322DRAFT_1101079 [Thelephora terrestris]
MPPRSRPACQICQTSESKYNCPKCMIPYCSLGCYRTHQVPGNVETEEYLRPLTSLSWPYVPEESAYTDPLKRDDPKVVQLPQYEAIATSAAVRNALSEHPDLKPLLRSIDSLRGREREATIQRALGVSHAEHQGDLSIGEQDVEAMRRLSSAIEAAIRGDTPSSLGLDLDGERS